MRALEYSIVVIDSVFDVFEAQPGLETDPDKQSFLRAFLRMFRQVAEMGPAIIFLNSVVNVDKEGESYFRESKPCLGEYWGSMLRERLLLKARQSQFREERELRWLEVWRSQSLKRERLLFEIRKDRVIGHDQFYDDF